MARAKAIRELQFESYARHGLHGDTCRWVEKNCYVDIWIEVVHALGLEPLAMLPFAAFVDFEGDQWTFFKPPHNELLELYGLDVQELYVWRPLAEHALEHLSSGKLLSTEADAFWLPDTAGTDYRTKHTKSTIVLNEIDMEARRLGYFHNAAYFVLEGEDFAQTLRLDSGSDPAYLPLFAETIRIDGLERKATSELVDRSVELWRRHLSRRAATNPVRRFRERFERDLPLLQERGLDYYHAWAFGTIRQLGAAAELAARNLQWITASGKHDFSAAAEHFEALSGANKTFILKGARAANSRRSFDAGDLFEAMAQSWAQAMDATASAVAAIRG